MSVPFFDLRQQTRNLRFELDSAFDEILRHGRFIMGPEVEAFEEEFAAFCGSKHCVSVGSGTAALRLALLALGIQPGDEVILPANTYIASALAVSQTGATPVFVDIDDFYHMDSGAVQAAITERTKALMPVHLYGQAMDLRRLLDIATARELRVIEDACQAHGARDGGRCVGTAGDVGCFSFYPSKNLGAFGDGGAVTTNEDGLASTLRLLRDFGQRRKYEHLIRGDNSRLDSLQAAILRIKLKHLKAWNHRRREIAAIYNRGLSGLGIQLPECRDLDAHVYHLYVVQLDSRDDMRTRLEQAGVQTGVHYPIPIHLQPAYSDLRIPVGAYPKSENACRRVLSLPMFPEMTDQQALEVVAALRACVTGREALGSKGPSVPQA